MRQRCRGLAGQVANVRREILTRHETTYEASLRAKPLDAASSIPIDMVERYFNVSPTASIYHARWSETVLPLNAMVGCNADLSGRSLIDEAAFAMISVIPI